MNPTGRLLIRPALQDATLVADAQEVAADREARDTFHLWWLGQSGYLVHWQGQFALLDPYLSDSLTRKYASTDKPHVRLTERVVDPRLLGFVRVVTASHAHTDHLDPDTLGPLAEANPALILVGPEAIRPLLRHRSGLPDSQILGLDALEGSHPPAPGVPTDAAVEPFRFQAVPAAHEGLDRDATGRHLYLGFVVRFGPWTLYHSGDTVVYPGLVEAIRPYAPDVVLLPINGRAAERRVAGNLWGDEAAKLAWEIGARVAIPGHYDQFEFNTATPDLFVATCQRLGQGYQVLRAGERWTATGRRLHFSSKPELNLRGHASF